MKIGLIVHDLLRTGAPTASLNLAKFLQTNGDEVVVFSKEGGPLEHDLEEANLGIPLIITQSGHQRLPKLKPRETLERAINALRGQNLEAVYVNSFAAAEWCLAANALNLPVILHVHELKKLRRTLDRAGIYKRPFRPILSGIIAVSNQALRDCRRVWKPQGVPHMVSGTSINIENLKLKASQSTTAAKTAAGMPYIRPQASESSRRPLIVMCGTATYAKGVDVLYDLARHRPEYDFIWIGDFDVPHMPNNPVLKSFRRESLPNFYCTESIKNPFPFFEAANVFAFTSRNDANPLVMAESMCLGTPILAFGATVSNTTHISHILTGRPSWKAAAKIIDQDPFMEKEANILQTLSVQKALEKEYGHTERLTSISHFIHQHITPVSQ